MTKRVERIPCPHDGLLWPVVWVTFEDGTEGVNVVVCVKCQQAIGVDQLPDGDLEHVGDTQQLRVVPASQPMSNSAAAGGDPAPR